MGGAPRGSRELAPPSRLDSQPHTQAGSFLQGKCVSGYGAFVGCARETLWVSRGGETQAQTATQWRRVHHSATKPRVGLLSPLLPQSLHLVNGSFLHTIICTFKYNGILPTYRAVHQELHFAFGILHSLPRAIGFYHRGQARLLYQ